MPVGGTGLPYVDASKAKAIEIVKGEEGAPVLIPNHFFVVVRTEGKKKPPLMNEHGNYPIWMNKREMRRHISQRKRILRKKIKLNNK